MSGASASQAAGSTTYSGKAHENVPEFSGRSLDYKEYRKRLLLYEKKMSLAGRNSETSFNVLVTLKGRAWDACEDIPMSELEGSSGMAKILERLDKVFKFDAITELPGDFEAFFCLLHRKKNSMLQEYAGDFERALRKLEAHNVTLPDKVVGWYFMRRAGLTQQQRQLIMSSIGSETLSLDTVRKAMNFVIGQDSTPEGHDSYASKSNTRWRTPYKDAIYYEDDDEGYDFGDDYEDDPECYWADDAGDDAEEDDMDDEVHVINDDLAAEYDEVLAGYTEARQRLNAMRMSRGYYPVVAMVPEQNPQSGKGNFTSYRSKGKGKSKSKSKSGKGGGSKQAPRPPPQPKARGRAALGAEKCLRCGQAGHRARNCPAAGKRKAETNLEADINMVADSAVELEEIQLAVEEKGHESRDLATMDCGAGSVLTSEGRIKQYLTLLMEVGFDLSKIQVFRCKKGFRFGNGEKNITSVCLLVPTFLDGKRRDILMYVIPGDAPFLFGRPIMEALQVTIDYSAGKIKWGKKAWKKCARGTRGEFICHMASDVSKLKNSEPASILLPDDFEAHVHPESLTTEIFFDGQAVSMLNVSEELVQSVFNEQETSSFTAVASILDATQGHPTCEKSGSTPDDAGAPSLSLECREVTIDLEEDDDDVVVTEVTVPDPGDEVLKQEPQKSPSRSPDECEDHQKLPSGKLRQLLHDTERRIQEIEAVLSASPICHYKRNYVLWEVFAGEGRVSRTAERRKLMQSERFSLQDGWDFGKSSHRMLFLRRLRTEEPDVVLLSPMCKLWSQLQELTVAAHKGYQDTLEAARQWDHDNILMFCAVVFEHQRRKGKVAVCEHPRGSRAWSTPAFESMQGFDAHIDQCMFGLRLPNDQNKILPVKKPTTFRVTSETLASRLTMKCSGDHDHTHLEGNIPGVGLRSWLAENYPQELASHLVNQILAELQADDIYAAEEVVLSPEEQTQKEMRDYMQGRASGAESGTDPLHDRASGAMSGTGQLKKQDNNMSLASDDFQSLDPVRKNRVLRSQVGPRAVEYVQRLHKNLGHPGWEVLHRMLREVQATENVLQAAKYYTCPLCYARKPPKGSPPASGLKCTEFNDRILVDSHWIACEDSMIKEKIPAPGTPAARRKEKDKKERRPTGRQCVLTIIDHATRYCSIYILRSEKAEAFTKGLERAWLKHFGVPKILRIDEAKGRSSAHVREWAAQRGITLEVQPAENHTWLGVVERKHQVVRRALELYMDQCGSHDLDALKEAATYVPHSINQLSFHRGFTPQQWVLGKAITHVHGLSGEVFNPAQEAIDEQGAFAAVQARRVEAARAFVAADSDAKLRRAFTQKFAEMQEELVIGQKVWYWRKHLRRLQKQGWRGPARIVAIEEQPSVNVYWLCHGTSLLRCGARQVRPMVEDTGMPVPADRQAALRDLQELKARSTTQFRDELRRSGQADEADELEGDDVELDAEYEPSERYASEDEPESRVDAEEPNVPGVVSVFLPRLQPEDRERTPRRRDSVTTMAPTEAEDPQGTVPTSPKRKKDEASADEPPEKSARATPSEPMFPGDLGGGAIPVPENDDDLYIETVYLTQLPGDVPTGWKIVDGDLELDDVMMAAIRKGEVNERKLSPSERAQFVEGKKKELDQYFSNSVWQFATTPEIDSAIKSKRVISARWVLTWKKLETEDGVARWKAKARLVLRGFQDPDILNMKTASPTAGRTSRTFLLTAAHWMNWSIYCADVQAAFLSGKGFDRVLIVRLPMDCLPLVEGGKERVHQKHLYMKMKKSAYGLCDAPLLWFQEAAARLTRRCWVSHPLDQCCFMLKAAKSDELIGLLILHVDDMLLCGSKSNKEFCKAVEHLRADFKFGKWDELTESQSLKYCGGVIQKNQFGIEVSYEEYIKKICPMTIRRERKDADSVSPAEVSSARGLIGALQWPATQGMPILCASMSIQAGEIPKGTVANLRELNKTLRFAKSNAAVTLKFLGHPAIVDKEDQRSLKDLCLICYADAAFGIRSDKTSQGGFVILACDKRVLQGEKHPASTISWRSFKVPRVCRSSLAAECQACATALEELLMCKTFLESLRHPGSDLKEIKDKLTGECALVTDCKALYDAVQRETIQQAADKRVAIEGLVIKSLLADLKCQWRSDGLTKIGARQAFVERYSGSHVQLVADMNFMAAKKKSKAERASTVAETRQTKSEVAQALIALVMASEVTGAEAFTHEDWTFGTFEMFMATALVGMVTLLWFGGKFLLACFAMSKTSQQSKADEEISQLKLTIWELEKEQDELEKEKDAILKDFEKTEHELIRVKDENQRLQGELAVANEAVRLFRSQSISGPVSLNTAGPIYVTPNGECWHRLRTCGGSNSICRRPCNRCVLRGASSSGE